jgi:ADP-ribose pyrophosphatase YjhB (NUDIX family)
MMGSWSFPSGFVDAGEVVEEAARRECQEETGLEVRIDKLLGVYSSEGERVIFVAYAGTAVGGEMEAGEECIEVRVFDPDALPELAFPNDKAVLEAWAAHRAGAI